MEDKLIIRGARENNLKNINIDIPKNKLVIMTGLSGSGKTSLAFDTIYAEGQRRYVESLSGILYNVHLVCYCVTTHYPETHCNNQLCLQCLL